MKTKEELNALRAEVDALNRKLSELSEDELQQVTGGRRLFETFSVGDWIKSELIVIDQLNTGPLLFAYRVEAVNGFDLSVLEYRYNPRTHSYTTGITRNISSLSCSRIAQPSWF